MPGVPGRGGVKVEAASGGRTVMDDQGLPERFVAFRTTAEI